VMPDLMRGDTLANHSQDQEQKNQFLTEWSRYEKIEEDCQRIFSHLAKHNVTRIVSIGFCWGVWVNFKVSVAGLPLLAGAGCHPSLRLEEFSGRTVESLTEGVNCPMLLASGRNDPDNVQEGGRVEEILKQKYPLSVVKSFRDVDHGWVTRGDLSDGVVAKSVETALIECSEFFQRVLGE
jgi:dienelactone hydrolase